MLVYLPWTVFSFRKYFGYCQGMLKAGCQKNQTFSFPTGGLMFSLNSFFFFFLSFSLLQRPPVSAAFQMRLFLLAAVCQLVVGEPGELAF